MSTTLFPASAISLSCLSSSGAHGRLAFFVAKIILQHAAKKEAADRGKINLHEAWELDHWTKELGVSKNELQKVIAKGNGASAVRKELGR